MKKERKAFESRFGTVEKEVLVLTQSDACAGRVGKAVLWDVNMSLLAYINVESGELIKENTYLTWQLTDEECKTNEKTFGLEKEQIYRLKVRESLPVSGESKKSGMRQGMYLMVIEVVERECKDDVLNDILAEYQKPVTICPEGCGKLLLDKYLGMFEGECTWNGEPCNISLEVDEDKAHTAEDALKTFALLMSKSKKWDDKARKYAAAELTENAIDWQQDEVDEEDEDAPMQEEITEKIFAKRMSISELCISTEGDFELYYDDDNMFWGHVIIVSGNIKSGFDSADIAG